MENDAPKGTVCDARFWQKSTRIRAGDPMRLEAAVAGSNIDRKPGRGSDREPS